MRLHRGDGKMGNGIVVDDSRVFYFLDEAAAKTGSQDNTYFGLGDAVALDVADRLVDLVEHSCVVSKIAKGKPKSNIDGLRKILDIVRNRLAYISYIYDIL